MLTLFIVVYIGLAVTALGVNLLELKHVYAVYRDLVARQVNGVEQSAALYFSKEKAFKVVISALMCVVVLVGVTLLDELIQYPQELRVRLGVIRICHFCVVLTLAMSAFHTRGQRLRLMRMIAAEKKIW